MSDLVFRTAPIERTVFQAAVEAAGTHGMRRVAVEDPITGALTYKRLLVGARVLGRKLMPLASEGKAFGVMLPNANGAAAAWRRLYASARTGPPRLSRRSGGCPKPSCCPLSLLDLRLARRPSEKQTAGPNTCCLAQLGRIQPQIRLWEAHGKHAVAIRSFRVRARGTRSRSRWPPPPRLARCSSARW
jgi:hypothetical protein